VTSSGRWVDLEGHNTNRFHNAKGPIINLVDQ
jgi:hypothetical protein